MRIPNYLMLALFLVLFTSCNNHPETADPLAHVDPFIGTGGHGHTYPGATVPFGMVQLSPQTRLDGWDGCSGYHFTDSVIYGFAHTALSGTGVSDYGDILLMPVVGQPVFDKNNYSSPFDKNNEKAIAGYYSVRLKKHDVLAELTATERVGYHRYTFPANAEANIIIDLEHRDEVIESSIEFVSDTEIRGMRRSTNWAEDMIWFFHIEFSKPFVKSGIALNDSLMEGKKIAEGKKLKAFVGFSTTDGEAVTAKVGLSAVDADGALKNLRQEVAGKSFDEVKDAAALSWKNILSAISVKGGTKEQLKVFYTALYHTMLQPNIFMDVDGRFRGNDRQNHKAEGFTNYTVFSLWDTYRAWHPLMTLIDQSRTNDFIRTMLEIYQQTGLLPIWELAGNETYCMIGNHSIPVIADAWMKGIRGFDEEAALDAMVKSSEMDHFGLNVFRQFGYISGDKEHESVSKALEYGYNDWCVATMAKEMGHHDIFNKYIETAQTYKNYFDPTTGFMRPRINGGWLNPFDPSTVDWNFTEANSWQYSFYMPHDVSGLADLHGGKTELAKKLDHLFEASDEVGGRDMKDITGLIGQYAHGNEPSHHMAYLYNYLGQPWKTQEKVKHIVSAFYTPNPDGLIGNEDCGQMSAWLIFSAMGFYPVCPGVPEYAFGTPLFPELSINLESGKSFKIIAENLSAENFYVQSVKLNGNDYPFNFLKHEHILAGGELKFVMGNKPNKKWGTQDEHVIKTAISEHQIIPVPVINIPSKRIKSATEIEIVSLMPNCEIYYTTDGSQPTSMSTHYTHAFNADESMTIKAVAVKDGFAPSNVAEAMIVKINTDYSIQLAHPYHPNYSGGSADALIDGIRGTENWRLGGWQGFQGTNLEAVVDLGKTQKVNKLTMGFLQDVRSWIWMPTYVEFYGSLDGVTYFKIANLTHDVPSDLAGINTRDLETAVDRNLRYIKVHAKNFGKIPDWHPGAGNEAYIFADEIIIK